jgi:hypothetical protein
MDARKGAADRAALYRKCAQVYWDDAHMSDSDRTVNVLAGLAEWQRAIDTAYEAGLTDGAQMAVGEIGEYPVGYDESDE